MLTAKTGSSPGPILDQGFTVLSLSLGGWVEKQKPVGHVDVHRIVAVDHFHGLRAPCYQVPCASCKDGPSLKDLAYTELVATCRITHPPPFAGHDNYL